MFRLPTLFGRLLCGARRIGFSALSSCFCLLFFVVLQESSNLLPFTPSPLRNEDYMGDVFIRKARQRRDFKFVYKRKIFLHSHPWPSQDPAFNRLVYLQVR